MRVLDLFSGIGGFSLGLERASRKSIWPDEPALSGVDEEAVR